MVITTEAQEKAKDIIRADLDAQFRGKVRFGSIRITPRPGPDEEEYLDVLVVYDGRREDLQAQVPGAQLLGRGISAVKPT